MILTISGPSGSGKTTLLGNLRRAIPDTHPLESITTRPPRASDQPGEYLYVSDNKFREIANNSELLWHVKIGDYNYGTRKKNVDEALGAGFNVAILEIGAAQTLHEYAAQKNKLRLVRGIYLFLDDEHVLLRRMKKRGGLSQDDLARRLNEGREWNKTAFKNGFFRKIDVLRLN
ncbi:MAG TPA: hypothetical protein VG753_01060, partial [Candidatus Paceibacterota bacterium]|nr:hypothetical protein [Candidatus Paceibacterota bacterium]